MAKRLKKEVEPAADPTEGYNGAWDELPPGETLDSWMKKREQEETKAEAQRVANLPPKPRFSFDEDDTYDPQMGSL